jgi:hypothetical protein
MFCKSVGTGSDKMKNLLHWSNLFSRSSSNDEGELGQHSPADASQFLPNVIDMLHNPVARRAYGSSRNGRGPDGDEAGDDEEEDGDGTGTEVEEQADADLSVIRVVRNLSMPYFSRKLVEHFDVQFRKGLLQWPSRAGLKH